MQAVGLTVDWSIAVGLNKWLVFTLAVEERHGGEFLSVSRVECLWICLFEVIWYFEANSRKFIVRIFLEIKQFEIFRKVVNFFLHDRVVDLLLYLFRFCFLLHA